MVYKPKRELRHITLAIRFLIRHQLLAVLSDRMKCLALFPFLVASALAGEIIAHAYEPLPQYTQEQNTATGEYGYSYYGGPSAKTEFRAPDGTTTGTYSYIDAHGITQTVNYIADEFGFRAAGSNIPTDGITPLDAPDVAAAKAAHLTEHSQVTLSHQRKKRGALLPSIVAAPVFHAAVPLATSSQSRFQIHNNAKIIEQVHTPIIAAASLPYHSSTLFLRKKRSLAAPLAVVAPLPPSSAKILDEFAQKPAVFTHTAPIAAPAALATTFAEVLPISRSSQSRFQIHKSAKIIEQVYQPIYAAGPVAFGDTLLPAVPAFPAEPAFPAAPLPGTEAVITDNNAISVESA